MNSALGRRLTLATSAADSAISRWKRCTSASPSAALPSTPATKRMRRSTPAGLCSPSITSTFTPALRNCSSVCGTVHSLLTITRVGETASIGSAEVCRKPGRRGTLASAAMWSVPPPTATTSGAPPRATTMSAM